MQALRSHKSISSAAIKTRSADVMGITCRQDGKVVYFKIEAVKGLDGEELGYVMNTWDTGLDVNTLPNEMWAEMIEEALREQARGLEELAGIELEITRNGNVVTTNNLNVETANTTKADILKLIIAMDILNARPIVTAIF